MNTNSNIYTVVYTSLIVIVVAAVLASVSMILKDRQEANAKAETISQMLVAAKFYDKEELSKQGNEYILDFYGQKIDSAFVINHNGNFVRTLDNSKQEIYPIAKLKEQNYNVLGDAGKQQLLEIPIFIFKKGEERIYVLACYGAGLWGPIWGYIALKEDLKSIVGVYFDHESETPGLGAKIKGENFRKKFDEKSIDIFDKSKIFHLVKAGSNNSSDSDSIIEFNDSYVEDCPTTPDNKVDAISGATMTCKGLEIAINAWLNAYKNFLTKNGSVQQTPSLSVEKSY